MDSSSSSLTLEHEKANAMRRFQLKRFLETMFHLFNLSATLYLFSKSSWFPITVDALSRVFDFSVIILSNSFYSFLLANAIILLIYALSHYQNDAVSSDDDEIDWRQEFLNEIFSREIDSHDDAAAVYSEIDSCNAAVCSEIDSCNAAVCSEIDSRDDAAAACSETECLQLTTLAEVKSGGADSAPEKESEMPLCSVETTESRSLPPIIEETVTAVTETMTTTMCYRTEVAGDEGGDQKEVSETMTVTCCAKVTANEGGEQKEVSEKKCYRRVQSERREEVAPPLRKEMKRSSTGLEKSKVRGVDDMSKEEFNRTVEEFIAMQKKKLREEQLEF